jgi:ABC-type transport system substrate-binding protein
VGSGPSLLVRQAIAHAINVETLVDHYYGLRDQRATQLLPPVQWGRDEAITGYEYNPDLARLLLAEAGYPDGFTTILSLRDVYRANCTSMPGMAQILTLNFIKKRRSNPRDRSRRAVPA